MIITCPKCESRYVVEPNQMGKTKRKVRCANCKHVWDMENAEQTNEMQTNNLTRRRVPLPIATRPQSNMWVWFVFTAVLLVFTFSTILGRHTIMKQWPKTTTLYAKLGFQITTAGEGLKILETEAFLSNQSDEGGEKKLKITGKIINTSDKTNLIPPIRISIEGDCQDNKKKVCILQTWEHTLAHSRLLPKETVAFETEKTLTAVNPDKIIVGF